jgi:hypothetical protein
VANHESLRQIVSEKIPRDIPDILRKQKYLEGESDTTPKCRQVPRSRPADNRESMNKSFTRQRTTPTTKQQSIIGHNSK